MKYFLLLFFLIATIKLSARQIVQKITIKGIMNDDVPGDGGENQ